MAERRYRPGRRGTGTSAARVKADGARLTKNRYAWIRTVLGQFIVLLYNKDEDGYVDENEYNDEPGPTVRLTIIGTSQKPVTLNLTALTSEELELTEKLFQILFDKARPVVAARDKVAQNAAAEGDDSYSRIYRQVPQFVIREGAQREDSQGIHYRPSRVPFVDPIDEPAIGELRDNGGELANGEPAYSGTENDWTQINES